MKLHHWILLTFFLVVLADVVVISTAYAVMVMQVPSCKPAGDMKREVHEVYPLLDK